MHVHHVDEHNLTRKLKPLCSAHFNAKRMQSFQVCCSAIFRKNMQRMLFFDGINLGVLYACSVGVPSACSHLKCLYYQVACVPN